MIRKARGKFDKSKVGSSYLEELDPGMAAMVSEKVQQADEDDDRCRVSFRWGVEQVELVKAVAEMMGVSYQQYIKQVVYRQAIADKRQILMQPTHSTSDFQWAELLNDAPICEASRLPMFLNRISTPQLGLSTSTNAWLFSAPIIKKNKV